MKRLAATACALVAAASAACAGDDSSQAASPAPPNDTVAMRLIAYRPDKLAVNQGATVTWSQQDAGVHTVTSGNVEQGGAGVTAMPDGTFDSGEIASGETYEFTFETPGTFPYFCAIHPATMRGEVRVNPSHSGDHQ